jgi:hypothetical protein
MDDDQRTELAAWAARLEESDSQELRAAGRAISGLLTENARLRAELEVADEEPERELEEPEHEHESFADSLRSRLRRRRAEA